MTKAKTVDRTDPKALMIFSEYNTFQGFYKIMSVFDIDRSGEDGKKHPVNGHDLDYHVVYSAHTADMFRIYYYRDKNLGKIVIGYIGKHL